MKSRLYLIFLLASGLAAGCVSNSASLAPAAQNPASLAPAAAGSQKAHRVVTRVLTPQFGRKVDQLPSIEVRITNGGSEPIEFSQANIAAFAGEQPIKVYGMGEYRELVDNEIRTDYVAAEASEQGAMIRAQWSGDKPGTTSALKARMDSAAQRSEIRRKETKLLGGLANMIHSHVITPGDTLTGTIRLQGLPLLSAQRLRLRIQIASETHELDFAVNR